jgi:hypothetical protein
MSDESRGFDPYDAVLADLRAKRDQIDQTIKGLEALRGGAAGMSGGGATVILDTNVALSEGPGAFLGMTIPEAAKKLLASKRQPMRNPDIAAAFKAGGLHMSSADPVNTIGSVLTRRANEVGDIVKVGRGTWGLKEWYPGRSFAKKEAAKPEGEKQGSDVPPCPVPPVAG